MMDEPLSSLDNARKREIVPYIERLPRDFDLPVLYVTHNIEELARLADRVLVLDRGRIVAGGSVFEVLERTDLAPLTGEFEAGALLEARVAVHRDDVTSLDLGGHCLRVPTLALAPGTTVRLRVSARDVALSLAEPAGLTIRNALPARILEIEAGAGGHVDVLLEVSGQRLRARITANAVHELGLTVGQTVFALVKSVAFEGRLLG
jgi:molybdate transport system ATP-binding protein